MALTANEIQSIEAFTGIRQGDTLEMLLAKLASAGCASFAPPVQAPIAPTLLTPGPGIRATTAGRGVTVIRPVVGTVLHEGFISTDVVNDGDLVTWISGIGTGFDSYVALSTNPAVPASVTGSGSHLGLVLQNGSIYAYEILSGVLQTSLLLASGFTFGRRLGLYRAGNVVLYLAQPDAAAADLVVLGASFAEVPGPLYIRGTFQTPKGCSIQNLQLHRTA